MAVYPIGITQGLGTWKFQKNHVERTLDNVTYDAAHPDDTLLLAGPARRGVARGERTSARTLRAIGLFQAFSMQSQAAVQPFMAIGSGRGFFLRGKAQSSWTLSRLWANGLNLLRALYHAAVEAGVRVDKFDDPAAFENEPTSQFFCNLDSELYYIPIGLGIIMRAKAHTLVAGCYLELCMIATWGTQIGAGQPAIAESCSGLCDRILPFRASDTMEAPDVTRELMDAVLGLAPTVAPVPRYTRFGTDAGTGLGAESVTAL